MTDPSDKVATLPVFDVEARTKDFCDVVEMLERGATVAPLVLQAAFLQAIAVALGGTVHPEHTMRLKIDAQFGNEGQKALMRLVYLLSVKHDALEKCVGVVPCSIGSTEELPDAVLSNWAHHTAMDVSDAMAKTNTEMLVGIFKVTDEGAPDNGTEVGLVLQRFTDPEAIKALGDMGPPDDLPTIPIAKA